MVLHKVHKHRKKQSRVGSEETRMSGFLRFCHDYAADAPEQTGSRGNDSHQSTNKQMRTLWHQLTPELRQSYGKWSQRCPDPVVSVKRPDRHMGSMSEKLESLIENYIDSNPDNVRRFMASSSCLCIPNDESYK